jgi:hypothetical protein
MALSEFSLITLITFLLGAGGGDLLDYVPTDAYWRAKQVTVTPDVLTKDLRPTPLAEVAGLIDQLDSPDAAVRDTAAAKIRAAGPGAIPALQEEISSEIIETSRRAKALIQEITADTRPASIRRLMAIRTLGERKERGAVDVLRPLLASKEPFVAEYAGRAIAQIEGTPYERPRPRDEMKTDLWLLPANCAAVAQFSPRAGLAIPFDQAIANMHIRPEQKAERVNILTEMVLILAERVGNMRIDGVTIGLFGDITDRSGFLVAVLRGQFDRVAFAELVQQLGTPAGNVDGQDVFQPNGESAMFFASDNQAVYMASPAGASLPVKEMIAAIKTGKGGLECAEGIPELIKSAKTDEALWAVARTTPEIRQHAPLAAFETVSLTGRQEGQTFHFQLVAQASDADKLAVSMQELNRLLKNTREWFDTTAPVMPPLKPVRNFLRSITPKVEGTKLTATATYQGPLTETIVFTEFPYATAKPVEDEEKPAEAKPPGRVEPEPAEVK